MSIYDREVHALGRPLAKLLLQCGVGSAVLRKEHNPGRVAIDPVHDERLPFPVRPQMVLDLIEDRHFFIFSLEWNGQKPSGLVEHDEKLIFVKNPQWPRAEWRGSPARAAGAIVPYANLIAGLQLHSHVLRPDFRAVHEHLAALP